MDQDGFGDQAPDQASLFPKSTGDKLREAREAQGLTLADIANRTRVPTRHLEAIENGDYGSLPSPTYTVGFAKAYARAVGLDERVIATEVRNNPQLPLAPVTEYETYQPRDAKRVPSFGLATVAGLIGVLVVILAILWYGTSLFRGSEEQPAPPPENTIAAAPEATPTPAPVSGGQVSLMATDSVWLKIHDSTGKTLLEKTMAAGERFDVPADANGPLIDVGRPDKIQITVNGSVVPPLGTGKVAIKDVPISAAALQARSSGPPVTAPTAAATPAPAATATARPLALPPAFQPDATPTPRAAPTPAAQPTSGTGAPPIP